MKIVVKSPLKAQEIAQLLDGHSQDGFSLRYTGKRGMELEFETDCTNANQAVAAVKSLIKATEFGKVLYFSVSAM